MTETEAKWATRVQEWRASDKTADDFARGLGYQASTLRYWASRLKKAPPRAASAPAIVRVLRTPRDAPPASSVSGDAPAIEIAVGTARVLVRRGFDPALLRDVVAALGGAG